MTGPEPIDGTPEEWQAWMDSMKSELQKQIAEAWAEADTPQRQEFLLALWDRTAARLRADANELKVNGLDHR